MADPQPDILAIFTEAAARETAEERSEFLDQACGDDPIVRRRVDTLLRAHFDAGNFLGGDSPENSPTLEQPATEITEKSGDTIGPYKLLQQIGEGGMGVVYMAEQKEPVKRRVALKIIKPGMDTRQVIARFEAERQALAMMDHPNIARVLDAGATDTGRPYFVMELVNGIPLTDYCDEQRLTPTERLELFTQVCQAVQHAHQKGVIHRDLKPGNILVAQYDHKAVPKVIDFGVAKATSQTLTEKTMFTQLGQIVGTLDYMSPEQARRNQLDVDTRSDIYSLGVILYELLTGETPFDKQRLRTAAFDEMLRIIREEEPPRPSTKLSSSETLPSVAANRHVEPHKLSTLIRGELDWIVMKALEKDRTRRYETASAFAADVQHYLNDEAVVACPPSAGYRFRKFIRRNKAAMATTSLVAVALIVGIVGTTWQAMRALEAERDAVAFAEDAREQAERADTEARLARDAEATAIAEAERADLEAQRASDEAERAENEAEIARTVNDFLLGDLLGRANPHDDPDRDLTVREVLDRSAATITALAEQPLVEAGVRTTIGEAYNQIGRYDDALQHLQRAEDIYTAGVGVDHRDTVDVQLLRLWVVHYQGEYAQALDDVEEVLSRCRRAFGHNDFLTMRALDQYADLLNHLGRSDEAEALLRDALNRVALEGAEADGKAVLMFKHRLANVLHDMGSIDEAVELYREVYQARRDTLGDDHLVTVSVKADIARALRKLEQHIEAEALLQEVLEFRSRVLGREHANTLSTMETLAVTLSDDLERHSEATELIEQALEIQQRTLGEAHSQTLRSMTNLGVFYQRQGHYAEAETLQVETLEIQRPAFGDEHPQTLLSFQNLLATMWHLEVFPDRAASPARTRREDARRLAEVALRLPELAHNVRTLGWARYRNGDYELAIEALEKSIELQGDADGYQWFFLAMAYWQLGDEEAAREWYHKGVDKMSRQDNQNSILIALREEVRQLLGESPAYTPAQDNSSATEETTGPG